ncbi:MAG: class I SAM-dependent methyltransferase [Aeromicrobium sp.]
MSLTCPACTSRSVHAYPASQKTGRVVAGCDACGTRWLTNPPAAERILGNYDFDREIYASYVDAKREQSLDRDYRSALQRIDELIESGGRALFDLGAGAGEFLMLAREFGFEPYGNELAPGAVEMARDDAGIELHVGELDTIAGENLYDAVTMWCVLAHVVDPDDLLRQSLRILKPGGILFLQTPRWSAMDRAALAAARSSRGRFVRLLDRRVSDMHMTLYSSDGLAARARRNGFEVVEIHPRARYSLKTHEYLRSLGVPAGASEKMARPLDVAVDRDLIFRNVLDLYARKPHASGENA